MRIGTITPHRAGGQAGRDGFGHLLRAEWTKFRTVRGWVIAMAVGVLVIVLVGLWAAASSQNTCGSQVCTVSVPLGPGGEAVTDSFYFVHQPLDGNGSLTVRVTSLTGVTQAGKIPAGSPSAGERAASQPWPKAGLILKEGTTPGSAYAAIMVTPGHGVRMQYNYTADTAGPPGAVSAASPRWLRLTRSGDTITTMPRPTAPTGPRSPPPAWRGCHQPCRPGCSSPRPHRAGRLARISAGEPQPSSPPWPPPFSAPSAWRAPGPAAGGAVTRSTAPAPTPH